MILKNELQNTETLKLLSFDIDNTLVKWNTLPLFLKTVLGEFGLIYSDEVLGQFLKAVSWNEKRIEETGVCDSDYYGMLLEKSIDLLRNNGISGIDFKNRTFEREPDFVVTEENIKKELEELAKQYCLIAYSNWYRQPALRKLQKYDFVSLFSEIYTFENNYIKLTGAGFQKIMDIYGLTHTEILHIGDSISDIIPPKEQKIESILVDYQRTKEDLYQDASAVVTEFRDIKKLLKRI